MSSGEPRGKSWVSGSHLIPNSRKHLSGDPDIKFTIYSYEPSYVDSDTESEPETSTSKQSETNSIVDNLNDSKLSVELVSNELHQTQDFPVKDIPLDHNIREDMLTFLNRSIEDETIKAKE